MASNDSNDVAAGPLTIATLSSYSLRHLEAARPKIGPVGGLPHAWQAMN
jgi:hypothetical protein